jgi:Calcium binding
MRLFHSEVREYYRVRPGVTCPYEPSLCIGGWQGWVYTQEFEGSDTVMIVWDSLTLRALSEEYICYCERENGDWDQMELPWDAIEPVSARDTLEDTKRAHDELFAKYGCLCYDEQGERIFDVVRHVSPLGWEDYLRAWERHLGSLLEFPFDATPRPTCRFRTDFKFGFTFATPKVRVLSIDGIDGKMGVVAWIDYRRRMARFPLCDLEPVAKESGNAIALDDYFFWMDMVSAIRALQ